MSGHMINVSKWVFTFSANATESLHRKIQNLLGLEQLCHHSRYLGLSYIIRKNKKQDFSHIKDKIWKKLQGVFDWWKGDFIKVVAQTIPTYTISVFKAPSSICDELIGLFHPFDGVLRRGK